MQLTKENLIDWKDRGQMMNLCGHSIFTIDEGDESHPVILFIHGFPTSSYDWKPIWNQLKKNHRLISLDMLGFGFSDKPNERSYTIHKQADLFDQLTENLKLDTFHVVAHDYGVSVAQELLARQMDGSGKGAWLSCSLLNGGLFPETHHALLIQKLMLSPLGKVINSLTGFTLFSKSFSKVFGENSKPSTEELEEFWQLINYNKGRHLFHNLITYINDRIEHRARWVNALQNSPIPLALINGSTDPVSGKHLVSRYKVLNCRLDYLAQLQDIGHYPQIEAPHDVAASLLSFIDP